MKSSYEQSKSRGFITFEDINDYIGFEINQLKKLLKSKEAYKRSIGVKLLTQKIELDDELISLFCDMLIHEKKLYTKIELCNALKLAPAKSFKIIINYLGVIGNNQHQKLPTKLFAKKSYPLPRDIIARVLAHMGVEVLQELINVLKTDNIKAIREAIDSIGFIYFYNRKADNHSAIDNLILCLKNHLQDDIIRWKIIRALMSFDSPIVIDVLSDYEQNDNNQIIRNEAKRSLGIIKSRLKSAY